MTETPEVKLIVLASSKYFDSPSFTLDNGIGKRLIDCNRNEEYLCGLISWKDIYDRIFPDPIFKRADKIYNEKPYK